MGRRQARDGAILLLQHVAHDQFGQLRNKVAKLPVLFSKRL
jgi:hypothetical protein